MIRRSFYVWAIFIVASCHAVFDNRYLPLLQYPYITSKYYNSHLRFDLAFYSGKEAYPSPSVLSQIVGIPEIFGTFNQTEIANAMEEVGFANPLVPGFADSSLIWRLHQKIQAESFEFATQLGLGDHFSLGLYWYILRLNSGILYVLDGVNSTPNIMTGEEVVELDLIRARMLSTIGIDCGFWNQIGFGDLDLYARYERSLDYAYKFRRLLGALRAGLLFPTGLASDANIPASVPFGGNGFYGAYVQGEAEFELKEDWKLGLWLRVSKRFARVRPARFNILLEQPLFGVVPGTARIDPGVTLVFLPYFYVENLRDGLGLGLQYTLISHFRDHWSNGNPCLTTSPVTDAKANSNLQETFSHWASEYLTLNAFYDFGKMCEERGMKPIVFLKWDIPISFMVGHSVAKTNKVALGIEFMF